ncbi:phytanoyl-CoA dioxygenase family protein [Novosphingobium sp. G106]|uniref:phytanoyl-CoA dioxygenase family protein n=1 Tax=Novosphingobium sp. G106 TaxID=2849500 RepID=UPI001C2DB7F1|nr:phytanoyl-CoA dioxygenase family protein [Novosphingobium sp. G106]MBV1688225.1 phytanoyl-CoA dioxygenase family protein [Novosphingobium sp. G106]
MIEVAEFKDSTPLLGDDEALRQRWDDDGCLYFRGIMDPKLMAWGEGLYREELAKEGLIDLANPAPVLIAEPTDTWRPCDRIGTQFWKEVVKEPKLVAILRTLFQAEPTWLPIAAHRSGYPSGPLKEGEYIFAGQHQDAFYNEGMNSTICWMPVRDVADMSSGTFAVAPGTHKRGVMHDPSLERNKIPDGAISPDEWRSAAYRVGDVVIFRDDTAHAALPNLSNEIRMSMDIRVGSSKAPQPVTGTVEAVDGTAVTIRTDDDDALVTVYVDDDTYIRDMNPQPRVPTHEVERIAYPGARVLAMAGEDRMAKVLRRNRY